MIIKKKDRERYKTSGWDNLGWIEQFCLVTLPIGLAFIFYMIMDIIGLQWYIRIPIAIGITTVLLILISWWAKWITERNAY